MVNKKILVAEDDITSATILDVTLSKAGYRVETKNNGAQALDALCQVRYAALLTDWMMPEMDGIELLRRVRTQIHPTPVVIMITALATDGARSHALDAGADDYIAKPVQPKEVVYRLENCLLRAFQDAPLLINADPETPVISTNNSSLVAVVIAASTGGPSVLRQVLSEIQPGGNSAFFIVQHGPAWMIADLARQLRNVTGLTVKLAAHRMPVQSDHVYIAPGDQHMVLDPSGAMLLLKDGPLVNFSKPAADPLFESTAGAFGRSCVAVVLSGLGRDAATGSAVISSAGGLVVVQDPASSVAVSMPTTVIGLGIVDTVALPQEMAAVLTAHVASRTSAGETAIESENLDLGQKGSDHEPSEEVQKINVYQNLPTKWVN